MTQHIQNTNADKHEPRNRAVADLTAAAAQAITDSYVAKINSAVEGSRDDLVAELEEAYRAELTAVSA